MLVVFVNCLENQLSFIPLLLPSSSPSFRRWRDFFRAFRISSARLRAADYQFLIIELFSINKRLNLDYSELRMMADADNVGGGSDSGVDGNFGFAFNNIYFSDRLLQIEIVGEPAASHHDSKGIVSNWDMDCLTVVETKTLHVNSLLLAAKSPFFYKLLTEGMNSPEKQIVRLRINASEEAAVMDLIRYMYGQVISATTASAVEDVLMAADKFEVASCVRHCSRLLTSFPMTPESSSFYLELPSRVLMAEAVQPLIDAAKQYLTDRFKYFERYQDEAMTLPLAGVEAILSSDDLSVGSEDQIYDFVLKWAKEKYPEQEERRKLLATRLSRSIRFPFLTYRKLKEVLSCDDLDHETASKLVLDAMFYKLDHPYWRAGEESDSSNLRLVERAYQKLPVKMVEFELPRPECVVYLDMKRAECQNLFPSSTIVSQPFEFAGEKCFLSAQCYTDEQTSVHLFGVFVWKKTEGFAVDFEFSARLKATDEFTPTRMESPDRNFTFLRGMSLRRRKMFEIPWTSLVGDDSVYFINGVLHLRVVLTLTRRQ